MKNSHVILSLAFVFSFCSTQKSQDPLFPIGENGKIGFIDASGAVIIKPIFLSAGDFSEGLCEARINGTYGYIDPSGNFVVPPQFDFAAPFSEDLAPVFLKGKIFFIDKKGQKVFDAPFSGVEPFRNGRSLVHTSTGKEGFLNKEGVLFIDTVFSNIRPFREGLSVVTGINHRKYDNEQNGLKKNYEMGIIDSLGNFVVPYGRYKDIAELEGGYFKVDLPDAGSESEANHSGFIDKTGKLIFSMELKENTWISGNMHNGLALMNLYEYGKDKKDEYFSSKNSYEGFVNLKGELVINDTTFRYANDFSDNRTIVSSRNGDHYILNTKGKVVSKSPFNRIMGGKFSNGTAFVEVGGKWGLMDTSSNMIVSPRFDNIDNAGMVGDYFFFYEEIKTDNPEMEDNTLAGIARKDGTIILKASMQNFDRDGFKKGIIKCIVKNKLTYITEQGNVLWQETDHAREVADLNIDYMNRGYFVAYSKEDTSYIHPEFERTYPKAISKEYNFKDNELVVRVRPEMREIIYEELNGITVFVANTMKKRVVFNTQDNRLEMKVQARDDKKEWRDIEYLPSSWCGNSYYTIGLEPQHCWKFATPVYSGDFKTKLRIALTYLDPTEPFEKEQYNRHKKEITIYSNEYDGSVNPGQFWRKQAYQSDGIMNPYVD